jgi:hypothetical protein
VYAKRNDERKNKNAQQVSFGLMKRENYFHLLYISFDDKRPPTVCATYVFA